MAKLLPIRLNVRTRILILFLALALTSLIVTGLVALYTIGEVGEIARKDSASLGRDAVRESTVALTSLTRDSMGRIATDQALLIDEIFWETEMELRVIGSQAASAEDNPGYIPKIHSFPVSGPPPPTADAVAVLTAPGATVTPGDEEYRAVAGLDDLLAGFYHSDGDLTAVYVATSSGILRSYPYQNTTGPDFDPRTRSWFRMAAASEEPVWTEPYIDQSGKGLIVTCAKRTPTKFGTWVVASDVTIDQLNNYTSLALGGAGYAVLINDKGTVISRPGLAANGTGTDTSFVPQNILESPNPGLAAVGRNMTAGQAGVDRILIGGNETFVAYAPVSSMNWSYAVFLPASRVTGPILATEQHITESAVTTNLKIEEQTEKTLIILAILFLLVLCIVAWLSWLLARMITRPVDRLREGAMALGRGDLSIRVDIRSGDEFEDLAGSFNRMAGDLLENIENLKRTTAEKERYTKELEIAKEIQDTFLPESVPLLDGYGIAAANTPAMEIGGDLYDFIPAGPGREGFVIADVSGKGVSAALYMALSRTLLHASGEAEADPSRAIRNANRLIYEDARSGMFITVFYGILDAAAKKFMYVNAGHNPPLLVRSDGAFSWLDQAKGIALGVVQEVAIVPVTQDLSSGDVLVLYTDGVTEAFNTADEFFGEERLVSCIRAHHLATAEEILAALTNEIRTFAGSAPQSDDITVIVIRVR